jgi:hypothetical protein
MDYAVDVDKLIVCIDGEDTLKERFNTWQEAVSKLPKAYRVLAMVVKETAHMDILDMNEITKKLMAQGVTAFAAVSKHELPETSKQDLRRVCRHYGITVRFFRSLQDALNWLNIERRQNGDEEEPKRIHTV